MGEAVGVMMIGFFNNIKSLHAGASEKGLWCIWVKQGEPVDRMN